MPAGRREQWNGPVDLGDGFRLYRERGEKQLQAVCCLRTHELGFELVLNIDGELRRSEVCRSTDDVLTVTERWKATMLANGWHVQTRMPPPR